MYGAWVVRARTLSFVFSSVNCIRILPITQTKYVRWCVKRVALCANSLGIYPRTPAPKLTKMCRACASLCANSRHLSKHASTQNLRRCVGRVYLCVRTLSAYILAPQHPTLTNMCRACVSLCANSLSMYPSTPAPKTYEDAQGLCIFVCELSQYVSVLLPPRVLLYMYLSIHTK
jgi:hypothetical protein